MKLLSIIAATACLQETTARPTFVLRIPNANGVRGVQALGHINPGGGGATNAFGEAFEAQGTSWTVALCQADSDGDGATNGEELGDPCCTWQQVAGAAPNALGMYTHPGVPDTFSADDLQRLKCPTAATETPTAAPVTETELTTPPLPTDVPVVPQPPFPQSASGQGDGSSSSSPLPRQPKPTRASLPKEPSDPTVEKTSNSMTTLRSLDALALLLAAVMLVHAYD